MSEIKLEAGQWYRNRDGEICYCIGSKPVDKPYQFVFSDECGNMMEYTQDGCYWENKEQDHRDIIEHLPDCTGFDWQEPKIPEGWRRLADEEVLTLDDKYLQVDGYLGYVCSNAGRTVKEVIGTWHVNYTFPYAIVRKIEPPQPPQPKYRAFANLKEFFPHRDRFVCINNPNDKYPELYRVNVFNDHTFWLHTGTGHLYARGLNEYRFADVDANGELVFSPFGVLDQ